MKGNVETKQKSKNAVILGITYSSFVNIFHNRFFKVLLMMFAEFINKEFAPVQWP